MPEHSFTTRGWLARRFAGWAAAGRRSREARELARLPDYLLDDIGVSRDGVPSLARLLRAGQTDA